jgi:branched-chain amino acid transport system permease protein
MRLLAAWPWAVLVAFLAVPPVVAPGGWVFAFLAQAAALIVFALSYDLLLGQTGLLSFGHATYAGLAAFVAAHAFNRGGIALPLLPLVGGAAGAAVGVVAGFVATRRAGTAFAMITLGIGELVSAAAWTLPEGFGGAAGLAIDRSSGAPLGGLTFGPAWQAYAVIAGWCLLACIAMRAVSATPFARIANAVRDNPMRVASLGTDPRRVRYLMTIVAGGFAGIAGTMTLINVELASAEGLGVARSSMVLIAVVIGGTGVFFGPVLGAIVMTVFSVALAGATRAWPFYLGLLFVGVVSIAPDGIAGATLRLAHFVRRHGWRVLWDLGVWTLVGCAAGLGSLVLAVETLYAHQLNADTGGAWHAGALGLRATASSTWLVFAALACVAALAWCAARRARARMAATR